MPEWSDLSDDELRSRLEQRGLSEVGAAFLVQWRNEPERAEVISELLDA